MNRSKHSNGTNRKGRQRALAQSLAASAKKHTKLPAAAKQIQAVFDRLEAKTKAIEVQKAAAEAQVKVELEKLAKAYGYGNYAGLAGAIAGKLKQHGQLRLPSNINRGTKGQASQAPQASRAESAGESVNVISPQLRKQLVKFRAGLGLPA